MYTYSKIWCFFFCKEVEKLQCTRHDKWKSVYISHYPALQVLGYFYQKWKILKVEIIQDQALKNVFFLVFLLIFPEEKYLLNMKCEIQYPNTLLSNCYQRFTEQALVLKKSFIFKTFLC